MIKDTATILDEEEATINDKIALVNRELGSLKEQIGKGIKVFSKIIFKSKKIYQIARENVCLTPQYKGN